MKTIIVIGSLVILFIAFQAFITMGTNKTENQPYKLLTKYENVEIRFYPSVTMATVTSSAKNYKELSSPGFRKLAGYIFGGNAEDKKIAMTSPVHMDINDSASSMSFVMPSEYTVDALPQPNDKAVNLSTTEDDYVAAIRFGGFTDDAKLELHKNELIIKLQELGITHKNNFRYLGYNPPYQVVGRRNEVIVSINFESIPNL